MRLVLLPASVTTAKGRPVTGLDRSDFTLFDGDRPQPIEFFAAEGDLPVSVAFVLDVSGSMALMGRLDSARQAIRGFVEDLRPRDRMGLICFADQQVTWVTGFTEDRERFLRRLEVQEALGPTALYDALAASPSMVDEKVRGRRAIVLLTDGLDNASRLTTLEAMWIARRVRVPIYVLDFVSMDPRRLPRGARQSQRVLRRFSTETGGALYTVHRPKQLAAAVESIQAELRFQYVMGFMAEEAHEDAFRPIRLETLRRGLRVRTRSGYYMER